jgi:endonuclease-3
MDHMKNMFDFGDGAKLVQLRDLLIARFGRPEIGALREPMGQLVKSLISSRTRDEVSLPAYARLARAYPRWADMVAAPQGEIEAVIKDVTFADVKAGHLKRTLMVIATAHPDFRLDFLAAMPVPQALAWLERLPGVGRKVAAATLSFSTLRRPALVIDTHILRVLRRIGIVRPNATTENAYNIVMAAVDGWGADDLAELHSLMKCLGKTLCRFDRACCDDCPIESHCKTAIGSAAPKLIKEERPCPGLSSNSSSPNPSPGRRPIGLSEPA